MNNRLVTILVLVLVPIHVLMVAVSYTGKPSKVNTFEDKHKVKKGQFLFVVDLNNGLCTGTLISSQWVLTSGHCIEAETMKVSYGSNHKDELLETEGVTIIHPYLHVNPDDYVDDNNNADNNEENEKNISKNNRRTSKHYDRYKRKKIFTKEDNDEETSEEKHDYKYDIGLIKLEDPVKDISPVVLPKRKAVPPQENETAINVGWGHYRRFETDGIFLHTYAENEPTILRQVNLTLRSPYECIKVYANDMDRKVCAGSDTENSCPGDSGSPLLVNGVQWGIDSYGKASIETIVHEWNRDKMELKLKTYCGAGPDIYVSTWHFLDWITCVMDFEKAYGPKFVGLYCAIRHP